MELTAEALSRPLRAPFASAHGTVTDRPIVLVTLRASDGMTGHGEAAPLLSYDGVSVADVLVALDDCRQVLAAYPGHAPVADVVARCAEVTTVAPALAAVDLALWDLAGRRTRQPIWQLLGGGASAAPPIDVNWTITAADRSGAAREAAEARVAGFTTVKLKVGIGDDAGRVSAVRAFGGPQLTIRLDANGAWDHDQAVAALRALEPSGIELCEEPVHGLAEFAALRGQTSIPLALDESAVEAGALDGAFGQFVCLKISRCGGIAGTLATAARARAAGYEVYLASTLDGPLGIAAALHCAVVLAPRRACGLATLGLFAGRDDLLPARGGAIDVPRGPGLGDGLLDWYGAGDDGSDATFRLPR
jgi:L-alanine-DL-glutamate epimerase-like enolase superfamily enzyme